MLLAVLFVSSQGCVTIFSDFQGAGTLGEGNTEVTPGASLVYINDNGDTEHIQTNLGAQVGYGISDNTDLRLRVEMPTLADAPDTFGDYIILGFGPKFSLVEDKLAAYIPIGFAFGSDIEAGDTFEIQPTLIYTVPLSNNVELNSSLKFIKPFESSRDATYALNAGLAFWRGDLGIRPEVGFMKSFEDSDGSFLHAGIALSIRRQ